MHTAQSEKEIEFGDINLKAKPGTSLKFSLAKKNMQCLL